MRGGSRIVVVSSASSRVMQPTAMNAACQSEVEPISGRVDGIDAAESRQHRAADQIGEADAAEAADAVNADRGAALRLSEIIRDQREGRRRQRRFAEAEAHAGEHELR